MRYIQDFFLFCSGANRSLLKKAPIEMNKYVGIGATIFFTGLLAAIASGYAAYTIFNNYSISFITGVIWGLMIFNLDRLIVSTMIKKNSASSNFVIALPRILLALLIAIVIAKPLELKIFQSEIESELVLMEQERFKTQDDLIKSRFISQIDTLTDEISTWKTEIEEKQKVRDDLIAIANAEADGTGGSGNKNIGPIYRVKKDAADKAQEELDFVADKNNKLIQNHESTILSIREQINSELTSSKRVGLSGFAARLEGLERAGMKSAAIKMATLFITLLFIAIELAPIITKLMMERGPYDLLLENHKLKYDDRYSVQNNHISLYLEKMRLFQKNSQEYRFKNAIQAEKELSDLALSQRLEVLQKEKDLWGKSKGKQNILDF